MILHETIVVAIIHDDDDDVDESQLSWVDLCKDCWCCHEHTTSVLVADVCCGGVTDGVGVDGGDARAAAADTTTTDGFMVNDDVVVDKEDVNDGGGIIVDDVDVVDAGVDVDVVNVVVVVVLLVSVDVLSAAAIVGTFSLLPILITVSDVSGVTDGLSSNCKLKINLSFKC